jgi:hypothetical protein
LQSRANVVPLEIREVDQNLINRRPRRKQVENINDANSHATYARATAALRWIAGDAIE